MLQPSASAAETPIGGKVKVLYVAGWGRSGSTLLGRIIGQIADFFLVGELRYVWDRGLIENRLCGCGVPFRECPVWRSIMSRAFGDTSGPDARALVSAREQGVRTRHLALGSLAGLHGKLSGMGEYLEATERLYAAAGEATGSRVIVDTSKFPSYAYALQSVPGIDLYVLHLVRDPRATAYSWATRRKLRRDRADVPDTFMTSHGDVKSSLVWDEWNLAIERIRRRAPERYMLLRYEDFVGGPRSSVASILRFLGEGTASPPFSDDRQVSLEVPHAFSGNPDRFVTGPVKIEPDDKWRDEMGHGRQLAVTAITLPGLLRYGYPLRARPDPQRQERSPAGTQ